MPCLDVHPECRARRVLDGDWRLRHQSMLTGSAPLAITFNGADENIYTFASSEVRKTTALRMGVHDETNEIRCELIMGLAQFKGQAPMTRLTVRADFRRIPFHRAVTDACQWWDTILQLQPMPVPRSCRLPMYSSWYNFHQAVTADTFERACALARKLGMETIILDDGWHSSHAAPGYGYTGDWEVCQEKFPDMRAHVQRVHDLGMKHMLWYSVPFIGDHAKCWARFENKLLRRIDRNACGVLDPRYQHPADEVGQRGGDLHQLAELQAFHLRKEDGEDHREHAGGHVQQADADGVLQHAHDLGKLAAVPEQRMEPLQPHKLAPVQREAGPVIIEGIPPARQRKVGKDEYQRQDRGHQQKQLEVLRQAPFPFNAANDMLLPLQGALSPVCLHHCQHLDSNACEQAFQPCFGFAGYTAAKFTAADHPTFYVFSTFLSLSP